MTDPHALFQRAVVDFGNGRQAEAETILRRILAADASHADALHLLGVIALQAGHPEPASRLIANAITAEDGRPPYHVNYGLALRQLGRTDDAEQSLRRAIKLSPQFFDAHYNLGLLLISQDRGGDADQHLRIALQLAPAAPEIENALATALIAKGDLDEAEELLGRAINTNPRFTDAKRNLAILLINAGRYDEARKLIDELLAAAPGDAESIHLDARYYLAREAYGDAIDRFERALRIQPEDPALESGLGTALMNAGQAGIALARFEKLAADHPGRADFKANVGLALSALARFDDAVATFDEVLAQRPDMAEIVYTRGLSKMNAGRFETAFDDYEQRWHKIPPDSPWRNFPQPIWRGENLSGRSLLIWAEQGIGDHLMLAGLIGEVERRGGRCIYECDRRLAPLLARSFPDCRVVVEGEAPDTDTDAIDFQIPMASLMGRLDDWPNSFVPRSPYLIPDPDRRDIFENRLREVARGRPLIGIAWRSARKKRGPLKSLPLADWTPILADRDALFINLQYGDTDDEIAAAGRLSGAEIYTDPSLDRMNHLDDLAAMIDCLDLTITTSNVTAHFAGGLGRRCWLAVQKSPLWYWGQHGDAPLFYPTIRSFRQDEVADWSKVVADLSDALSGSLSDSLGQWLGAESEETKKGER